MAYKPDPFDLTELRENLDTTNCNLSEERDDSCDEVATCSNVFSDSILSEGSDNESGQDDSFTEISYVRSAETENVPKVEEEENVENIHPTAANEIVWAWQRVNRRIIKFTGDCGLRKELETTLQAFLLFFDDDIMKIIVENTNESIKKKKQNATTESKYWYDVTKEEMYRFLGLLILMGIIVKPTVPSYFSTRNVLKTPIFPEVMSRNRFQFIDQSLSFANDDDKEKKEYEGSKELLEILLFSDKLNENFQKAYWPSENISVDESLTHWNGTSEIKVKIPRKSAKYGIKTYELCESSTGYLWNFIIYGGKKSKVTCSIHVPDGLKTSKIVVKLCEPLKNRGHKLWMDNYFNSPCLSLILRDEMGFNVAGTLRACRRDIPESVKSEEAMRDGDMNAEESNGVMVIKWKGIGKNPVRFISTFHDISTETRDKRGKVIIKPKCIQEYNENMGGVDRKDQMLQYYSLERKNRRWHVTFFQRLLNVAVFNAFILYTTKENLKKPNEKRLSHLDYRIDLVEELFKTYKPQEGSPAKSGRPSQNSPSVTPTK